MSAGNPESFFDTDGDAFTVKLTGPGSVEVLLDDPDGDGRGPISTLQLAGTTAKSKLSVAVKGDGDGEVSIGAITGAGDLRSFSAPKSDLVGSGLDVDGTFGSLKLSDVRNGAEITLDGTATNRIALVFGEIGDGSDLTFSTTVTKLTALRVGTGEWSAPSFGLIATKSGGFGASVLATATAEQLGKTPALRALNVIGGDLSGDVNALGNVGTISVKQSKSGGGNIAGATLAAANFKTISATRDITSSVFLAGADLGPDFTVSAGDNYGPGTIGKFSAGGNVAASVLGAGLFPADLIVGNDDDGLLGGTQSVVKKFTIKGSASADSLFASGVFPKKTKIGGSTVTPLSDPRFLTVGSPDIAAPVLNAALTEDTGASASDNITLNPNVSGRVTDNLGAPKLSAAFGTGALVDVSSAIGTDGRFTLDAARLTTINGGSLPDGSYTLRLQASDAPGNLAPEVAINFELDRTAPGAPVFNLSPGSDTGVVGDQLTSAAVVQLTGQAAPNVSVLLGNRTALASATGSFVFPDVALATGDNLLTAQVLDVAGNAGQSVLTITRSGTPGADVVLEWNSTNLEAIRFDATAPPTATRGLAMVSGAMFDVVNAFEGTAGFFTTLRAPTGASLEAAVGAAAHDVLVYLFPGQKALFDATLTTTLGRVPDGAGETSGVGFGAQIAATVIALRAQDGFNAYVDYAPGSVVGDWQQTGPMFDIALAPQWALLDPFLMASGDQFRPAPPPALESAEYAAAFNEVKALGVATGSTRTAEQTQIARFWSDGAGTYTPPGHWNTIAMELAQANGLSLAANARMLAQLNLAMADAAIVSWDAKYFYETWRPITAIHDAALDGNAQTTADPVWQPLLITPPFPEYTSGHSTFSGAASTVLGAVFGEQTSFSTTGLGLPGVTRSFTSFDAAADEAGRSRIFGGIHFQFANEAGLASGRALGDFVLDRFAVEGDFAAPKILLEGPASGLVTKDNFTISGRVLDNISGVASFKAQLDGGTPFDVTRDANGAFSLPVTLALDGTTDGAHTFIFSAVDAAGNATAPENFTFTLDTRAPTLAFTPALEGAELVFGSRLAGTAAGTGSSIRSLSYAFDGSTPFTVGLDPATGAFDSALDLSALPPGAHALAVTSTDSAGLTTTSTFNVNLAQRIPFTVIGATPGEEALDVGTTYRPQLFFSRPVNPTTLNANNFFATGPDGAKLPATIVPGAEGEFAWLFFNDPMPGGANITLHVDGTTILAAADATPLDADRDATPGGQFESSFTTVSLTPLLGTSLSGRVFDPGPDLKPMTFDDIRAGADGVLHSADDVFLNPLAGVKVFIVGRESDVVFTDANGAFSFASVPAGNVKLAIDGNTATNEPAGFYFPEMVMDLNLRAGQANTVMGSMGTLELQADNADRAEVYLPRLRTDILENVSNSAVTMVGVDPESAPNLTEAQRQRLILEVQPGSLVDANGQPIPNGQVGISAVPPALVRDMLPPGVLQHTFDITIQAPGAAVFNTPLEITFPNVFNAAPGTKLDFLSFDHTTGRLVIEGTATVSADGLSATTDAGTGITKPGWHGLTPPGLCVGSGGAPLPVPPRQPNDFVVHQAPVYFPMIFGENGTNFAWQWEAPAPFPNQQPRPPPDPGCEVPQRPNEPMAPEAFLKVRIEIDGPLARFMKEPDDLTGGLDLVSQSFTLLSSAGDRGPVIFAGEPKNYDELFGANGFKNLFRDQLYGSKITVTETRNNLLGLITHNVYTYYLYRWVDVIDAEQAVNKTGNTAAFHRTWIDPLLAQREFIRTKDVDVHLPGSVNTEFTPVLDAEAFSFGGKVSGETTVAWRYRPTEVGLEQRGVSVRADDFPIGTLEVQGRATARTLIDLNEQGFKAELERVIRALKTHPDTDIVFYERDGGSAPSEVASDRFKSEFAGFLPNDRQAGPDGMLDTADDTFTGGDLAARIDTEFTRMFDAVKADFAPVNGSLLGLPYAITRASIGVPDVKITWGDLGDEGGRPVAGLADQDPADDDHLEALIKSDVISEAAKQWALAEMLNPTVQNSVAVAISNPMDWTSGITLGNKLANTVSHEIAHTFGLRDAYVRDADLNQRMHQNLMPMPDLMNASGDADGDKEFSKNNVSLLQAALGFHPGNTLPLTDALRMYRNNFNLPESGMGIQDETDPNFRPPELAVFSNDTLVLPGELIAVEEKVAVDGPGGAVATRDLVITNPGLSPITIQSATFGAASAFSLVNEIAGTVLEPDASTTLTLRFDPQSAGTFEETLTFFSNANVAPVYAIQLAAEAIPNAPTAALTLSNNNFGGVALTGGTKQLPALATITNQGAQPLLLSSFQLTEGEGSFSLLGLPPDIAANPIALDTGESFTFGLTFDPAELGLQRALLQIGTNDPAAPLVNAGAVGTGIGSMIYPDWGDDFVAIRANSTIRTVSDAAGNFEVFLPPQTDYEAVLFDPVTGLVSHNFGGTPESGRGFDLTSRLVFDASTAPDTDFDGLPDDIEFAIGTGDGQADTDRDGISDFAEVLRGLDPLGGRSLPIGVVSAVALAGEAKEVTAAALASDPAKGLAFVATGSNGIAVVDVTDVSRPTLLGQLDLPGDVTDVAVDPLRGIAVVAANAGGVHFVDVSDPTEPALLSTVTAAGATQVEVSGGRAFVAGGTSLRVYDVLSGEQLQLLQTGPNALTGLALDDTALFTMENGNTLRAFELVGGTLVARDTLAMPIGSGKLFAADGVAYAGATIGGAGGFATADVSDLSALTLISDADNRALGGTALAASGSRFGVLAGHTDGLNAFRALDVVDLSDPGNTGSFITRINLPERPLGLALGNGFALVADGVAGLQIVNFLNADVAGAAPTLSLSAPGIDVDPLTAGTQVVESTGIPVRIDATDDVGIARVDLLINGAPVVSDLSFPFDFAAIAPALATLTGGPNLTLQARAIDLGGNVTLSAPIAVTIVADTFAPTLVLQNPPDGAARPPSLQTIVLTFSEPMDRTDFTANSIHLTSPGGEVAPTAFDVRAGGRQVHVSYPALAGGSYTLTLDRNEISDVAGNLLGAGPTSTTFDIINATVQWINPAGGNFNDPANWSTNRVPGPADDVFIGLENDFVVTINLGVTVNRLFVDESLEVLNSLTVTTGSLTLHHPTLLNATLSANVVNHSVFTAAGVAGVINGTFTNAADGTLRVSSGFGAELSLNGNVTNAGLIEVNGDSVGIIGGSQVFMSASSTLTNTGIFRVQGVGGTRIFNGAFTNLGTIDVLESFALRHPSRMFDSSGGTITVAAGETFDINGGTTTLNSTTVLGGAGNVTFTGTQTVNLAGDVTIPANLGAMSTPGTIIVNGPGKLINASTFTVNADDLNVAVENRGLFIAQGSATDVSGLFTNIAAGTVRLLSGAALSLSGNATNAGLLEINGSSTLTIGAGTVLTNSAGGIIRAMSPGGNRTINGSVTNNGTVDLLENLTIQHVAASIFATTTGTLSIAASRTLTVTGGKTTMGTNTDLVGSGVLAFTGTQELFLESDVTLTAGGVSITLGAQVTRTGPGQINGP